MKQIIINVDSNGQVVVETDGFHGRGCTEAARPFREALLGEQPRVELKPEYHIPEPQKAVGIKVGN